jgi:hypothetical protein
LYRERWGAHTWTSPALQVRDTGDPMESRCTELSPCPSNITGRRKGPGHSGVSHHMLRPPAKVKYFAQINLINGANK